MAVEEREMEGRTSMTAAPRDVLPEDRLLWEFWLNHGLDAGALRQRLAELPAEANGDYIVSNALYGCFERGLERLVAQAPPGFGARSVLAEAVGRVEGGPSTKVSSESAEGSLLACLSLRPDPGGSLAAKARSAAARVRSWPAFRRAACRANLVPAVVSSMEPCGVGGRIPEAEQLSMRRAAEGIGARNARLMGLLTRILDAFADAGLSPVLLKESALLRDVYRVDGDRMVGDLDLLFAHSEVDEAERVLMSLGYTPFEGIWSRAWYRAHHHHLAPLVSAAEAVKIEPHTGIWIPSGPSAPVIPEMIAASRPHPAFRARRPQATHLLFHMLVDLHGNVSIGKLGQAADIAALIHAERTGIDAAALADLAQRTGATPFLEDSLFILSRVYGEDLLAEVAGLSSLLPRRPPSLERRLLRRMSMTNFFGFDPQASPLSLAGVRLVHKALLRPGGRASRIAFVLRTTVGAGPEDEGVGTIAKQSRGSRAQALARAATFPARLAMKALGLRRRERP